MGDWEHPHHCTSCSKSLANLEFHFLPQEPNPKILELFCLRQRFLSDVELKALINQDEDGAPPEVGVEGGSDRFLCNTSLFI